MKARNYFSLFSLLFLIEATYAAEYEDLVKITKDSETYLKNQLYKELTQRDHPHVNISSHNLDKRLRLKACAKPLTREHRRSSALQGSISVKVSCNTQHSWSIYTKHRIALEKEVLVFRNNVSKHQLVTQDDLMFIKRDIYTLRPGYMTNTSSVIGQQLKRTIAQGQLVYGELLQLANIVEKGDAVNVIAKIGLLSVITPGIALSDGRKGDQIRVENKRSSRVIHAEVVGPNTVEVIL